MTLQGFHAFWLFLVIDFLFLVLAIVSARLVSPKKPTPEKQTTYECGQPPFGEARSFKLTGISRYYGYAVVFFAVDAFGWMVLTSSLSMQTAGPVVKSLVVYSLVIFAGIAYFLFERNNMVN